MLAIKTVAEIEKPASSNSGLPVMKILLTLVLTSLITMVLIDQKEDIYASLILRGAEIQMGNSPTDNFEDGLHVSLCGAGGPLPAPKASGPCVMIVAGEKQFVIDAGTNGARNLARMGYALGKIDAVFLTHFHSDHIDGLGEMATLRWVSTANSSPLKVFGPDGVEFVVSGFNAAYAASALHRNEHHGDEVAPLSGRGLIAKPFPLPPHRTALEIFRDGDTIIEAITVDHGVVSPAVGYRIRYKDRSALISGDSNKSANIAHFAAGIDLLVHDALAPNLVGLINKAAQKLGNQIMAKITIDILDYHASPMEAAETAREANVGHLLLYHIVPPLILPGQSSIFLDGAETIFPNLTIGQDGTSFSMPVGTQEINLTRSSL